MGSPMLLRHSIIYILAKIIPAIMAFAALSLYTHLLSPSEYGVYTLIFTGAVFLHNVIFNWLPAGTLRFWSNQHYDQLTFTSTLARSYTKILLGLLAITLIIVAYYWQKPEAIWAISTYLLLLALAIYTITQSIFSVKIKPVSYAYLTISYSTLALLTGTMFAYLGFGATGVLIGISIGLLIPALFAFKQTWLPYSKENYNKDLFKKIWVYGLPLASAALLEELTKVIDRFMLAGLQGKSEAGLYAVGYDLSGNSILMIMSAISLAAYPVIIKLLDDEGKDAAMDYFHKYVILLLGVAIPSVVGLNLVGPDLVYLLIEEQFQESVITLLPWITSAVFLMGLQAFYFDLAFQLGHYVIAIVKISVVIAVVNFSLNYWLIPTMGINGAAIATLSSFAIGSILSAIMGRRHFTLPFPMKEFTKIVLASLVMGFCLWWLKEYRGWGWLALQLGVGIISYVIMILAFNVLDIRAKIKERISA
jgi:O-antigen/teichoic acid export membrane protein